MVWLIGKLGRTLISEDGDEYLSSICSFIDPLVTGLDSELILVLAYIVHRPTEADHTCEGVEIEVVLRYGRVNHSVPNGVQVKVICCDGENAAANRQSVLDHL